MVRCLSWNAKMRVLSTRGHAGEWRFASSRRFDERVTGGQGEGTDGPWLDKGTNPVGVHKTSNIPGGERHVKSYRIPPGKSRSGDSNDGSGHCCIQPLAIGSSEHDHNRGDQEHGRG